MTKITIEKEKIKKQYSLIKIAENLENVISELKPFLTTKELEGLYNCIKIIKTISEQYFHLIKE